MNRTVTWPSEPQVEPSLYGSDFARLGDEVDHLLRAGVRVFHFDVGDGHFVEPITIGPIVLQSISERIHAGNAMVDVHLMVERPEQYFDAFRAAGGDSVTFHVEAVEDVAATVAAAHARGLAAGVAFNPESEPEDVAARAAAADLVLCMSIHPGYSGQPFQERTYDRVRRLRALLPAGPRIQVDGGVDVDNIARLRSEGATLFVAGAAIFGVADRAAAYHGLVQALA